MQPYLGVAVSQMKPATKGAMMVDTSASITLVTPKWVETHGLMITPVSGISIMGTSSTPVDMVEMCTMMVQLSLTLELDVGDVNISAGNFYQAHIGCNILGRLHASRAAVLGPAVIHMPGPGTMGYISWMQPKSGCMAYAEILAPAAAGIIPVTMTQLPPLAAQKPATFESKGICLSEEHKKRLRVLAMERDA